MFPQEPELKQAELTPKQAHAILFEGYVCGRPPIEPPPISGAAQGGRKSTRIHTRNRNSSRHRRRHRRHAQRGGAKLGDKAAVWAQAAEQIMNTNYDASPTLRFYRLIIFLDIVHLLGLDSQAIDIDNCNRLVTLICSHLNNEDLLTAYFKQKFGSMPVHNRILGLAGIVYEADRYGITPSWVFSSFTQTLSYISNSETAVMLYSYAVMIVNKTMDIWGLGWSLTGIINWALFLFGIKQTITRMRSKSTGEKPSVKTRIFNFVFGSFITARDGFIAFPYAVNDVLTKAKKYYDRGVRGVASDAKNGACSKVVTLLVASEINSKMLLQLGTAFETIIREFDPTRVEELKCGLMSQITDPHLIHELNELANPESRCAAGAAFGGPAQGAAAAFSPASGAAGQQSPTLFQSPPPQQQQQQQQQLPHTAVSPAPGPELGSKAVEGRSRSRSRDGLVVSGPAVDNPNSDRGRGTGRWKGNRGGSSKHKKKHPRSTNKRKRVGRRSMKNKKRVNGKW
jgi:hypothetical protein